MGMTTRITCEWKGKMSFETESPGGKLRLDADASVGGDNSGLRPKPLVLVALAGCTSMDVASLFAKMRAVPDNFRVDVIGDMTEEHPKYYDKTRIEYHFWGKDLKKDKLEKAVDMSLEKYCGVTKMVREFADVSFEIIYHEE